jgi:hypothetical protein
MSKADWAKAIKAKVDALVKEEKFSEASTYLDNAAKAILPDTHLVLDSNIKLAVNVDTTVKDVANSPNYWFSNSYNINKDTDAQTIAATLTALENKAREAQEFANKLSADKTAIELVYEASAEKAKAASYKAEPYSFFKLWTHNNKPTDADKAEAAATKIAAENAFLSLVKARDAAYEARLYANKALDNVKKFTDALLTKEAAEKAAVENAAKEAAEKAAVENAANEANEANKLSDKAFDDANTYANTEISKAKAAVEKVVSLKLADTDTVFAEALAAANDATTQAKNAVEQVSVLAKTAAEKSQIADIKANNYYYYKPSTQHEKDVAVELQRQAKEESDDAIKAQVVVTNLVAELGKLKTSTNKADTDRVEAKAEAERLAKEAAEKAAVENAATEANQANKLADSAFENANTAANVAISNAKVSVNTVVSLKLADTDTAFAEALAAAKGATTQAENAVEQVIALAKTAAEKSKAADLKATDAANKAAPFVSYNPWTWSNNPTQHDKDVAAELQRQAKEENADAIKTQEAATNLVVELNKLNTSTIKAVSDRVEAKEAAEKAEADKAAIVVIDIKSAEAAKLFTNTTKNDNTLDVCGLSETIDNSALHSILSPTDLAAQ